MTDSRFTTIFNSADELVGVLDVDELEDIDVLLMVLFARPMVVITEPDPLDEEAANSLEIIVGTTPGSTGALYEFPMNVLELVRSCAESVNELGPYQQDDADAPEPLDISAMNDAELIAALQEALGRVRLLNMLDEDE